MQADQAHRLHLSHLSDEELLLFSDQELSTRGAAAVREHVAQCDPCRTRLIELEDAASRVADLYEEEIQAQGDASLRSRSALKARLSEAPVRGVRSRSPVSGALLGRQLASACIALLLVVGTMWAVKTMMRRTSGPDDLNAQMRALPRRALTPGSTRAVLVADLCRARDLDNDPPVNLSLEQAVFREYGVSAVARTNYALDYLITPELGGADNIQNLWPQPYSSTWNAHVKDQLEDHLHDLVCQGKVQLETAQNDMASDWIASYKRYFNTDKPEPVLPAAAKVRQRREFDLGDRGQRESRGAAVYEVAMARPVWRLSGLGALPGLAAFVR